MFKLTNTRDITLNIKFRGRKIEKVETVYTYENDNGAKLSFHANPNKAWTWAIVSAESNDAGITLAKDIVEFHCANA